MYINDIFYTLLMYTICIILPTTHFYITLSLLGSAEAVTNGVRLRFGVGLRG